MCEQSLALIGDALVYCELGEDQRPEPRLCDKEIRRKALAFAAEAAYMAKLF